MVQPVAVTTTLTLKGFAIREYKGIVPGSVVRFPTLVQGLFGGLKSIVGGRIGAASEMGEQARRQAYGQMISPARKLGANRIVGTRYDGSDGGGASAPPPPWWWSGWRARDRASAPEHRWLRAIRGQIRRKCRCHHCQSLQRCIR